jgi:hypothetical protein
VKRFSINLGVAITPKKKGYSFDGNTGFGLTIKGSQTGIMKSFFAIELREFFFDIATLEI